VKSGRIRRNRQKKPVKQADKGGKKEKNVRSGVIYLGYVFVFEISHFTLGETSWN